jgi:hypothetical protein
MTTIDEMLSELWVAPFNNEDEVERVAAEQAHRALVQAISHANHVHDRRTPERALQDRRLLRRRLRSVLALGAFQNRRGGRRLVAVPAALIAAALIAVLLLSSAGPTTTPAYALTRHANGSITITINDLATGIPALNARMKALGGSMRPPSRSVLGATHLMGLDTS